MLASFYPRFFGYYERAVAIYTHISDQVFRVRNARDLLLAAQALYVLDGLLENNTILRLREHYTDTHGFTRTHLRAVLFAGLPASCRACGIWPIQQLYKLDRKTSFGKLDPLFRGSADAELIAEQWDQMVRVGASLKNHTAPAEM